jgi:hypothetical protein
VAPRSTARRPDRRRPRSALARCAVSRRSSPKALRRRWAELSARSLTSGQRSWPLLVNAAAVQSPKTWQLARSSARYPRNTINSPGGTMLRRDVLKLPIGAAAGASVGSPAVAQRAPQIRWRLTSSFTLTLDITYSAAEQFCRYVGELTEGRFIIGQFAAGELVPRLQALDAASNGATSWSCPVLCRQRSDVRARRCGPVHAQSARGGSPPSRSRRARSIRRRSGVRSTRVEYIGPMMTRSLASTKWQNTTYTPGWQEGGTPRHG